jgi:hypothetical protein
MFATIFACSMKANAQTIQYVALVNTNYTLAIQYPLQTNQLVSVVGFTGVSTVFGSGPGGTTIALPGPSTGPIQIFTGLTNITFTASNTTNNCATLQITTPANVSVVSNYVPADAIVIPASATGNVEIILESSLDLVNWTAASPGTYSAASSTNRFFRVRAVCN